MVLLLMVMVAAAMLLLFRKALLFHSGKLRSQGSFALHSISKLLAGELVPGGRHDGGSGVVLPQQSDGSVQLGLGNSVGSGQDDRGSSLYLIIVELAEVLHVDLYLAGICNSYGIAQSDLVIGDLIHGTDHIGQLAHTGGLDQNTVRVVLVDHLCQSLAEVSHQRAADTTGVHLRDVDACILQKAAIDADLAELILNKHQLLTGIGFLNHFLD